MKLPIAGGEEPGEEQQAVLLDRLDQRLLQVCDDKMRESDWPRRSVVSCPACGANLQVLLSPELTTSQYTEDGETRNNPKKDQVTARES